LKKIKIIAEVGVNHNGQISLAKKLIKHAKSAGADYVKFQCYISDELVTDRANKAKYQKKFGSKESQKEMLKKYELTFGQLLTLKKFSKKVGIKFMLSVFDVKSLHNLRLLKLNIVKIPSGELNNFQLMEQIVKYNLEVILSTGMSTFSEISKTVNYLKNRIKKKITILHCISSYPTNPQDVQINNISKIKKKFRTEVGFSDHTDSYEAAVAATTVGVSVIEKHLTINKKMKGPDHSSSLDPKQFLHFVKSIRNTEKIIINKNYKISSDEFQNSKIVKKSIVAKKKIKKGEKFTRKNITTKRPDNGISASNWFKVLNKTAKKNFEIDDKIKV
jgi:N,N'-diacetyllegionaminate synthase|tara:strand:+ start:2674 stop:3669 length:996 start_codon:yes stop_codon:yes gene_type:complete